MGHSIRKHAIFAKQTVLWVGEEFIEITLAVVSVQGFGKQAVCFTKTLSVVPGFLKLLSSRYTGLVWESEFVFFFYGVS